METPVVGESSELQQLVSSDGDENEDAHGNSRITNDKILSPVRSVKVSSSGSHASSNFPAPRLLYINEKRNNKESTSSVKSNVIRPRNVHKANVRHHDFLSQVPDVRHMEKALLGLLDDFHSGKLRAFGSGCTMERMTDIREQQEKLAKLHFDLGAAYDPSLSDASLKQSQTTMSQLIQRLEQLSVSIECLHNNHDK